MKTGTEKTAKRDAARDVGYLETYTRNAAFHADILVEKIEAFQERYRNALNAAHSSNNWLADVKVALATLENVDAAVRREWKTLLGEDAADGAAAGKTHSRNAAK